MLDRSRYAAGDVELRRHHLARLADLPVVRRIAGIDGRAAGADGSPELVGNGKDDLAELLRRAQRPSARDDDLRRRQLRTVGGRQRIPDEGRKPRVGTGGNGLDRGRATLGRGGEGGRAHRDDLLGIRRLHRLDGVAGIDRPLEGV